MKIPGLGLLALIQVFFVPQIQITRLSKHQMRIQLALISQLGFTI
jgi:hypothetical protein